MWELHSSCQDDYAEIVSDDYGLPPLVHLSLKRYTIEMLTETLKQQLLVIPGLIGNPSQNILFFLPCSKDLIKTLEQMSVARLSLTKKSI